MAAPWGEIIKAVEKKKAQIAGSLNNFANQQAGIAGANAQGANFTPTMANINPANTSQGEGGAPQGLAQQTQQTTPQAQPDTRAESGLFGKIINPQSMQQAGYEQDNRLDGLNFKRFL